MDGQDLVARVGAIDFEAWMRELDRYTVAFAGTDVPDIVRTIVESIGQATPGVRMAAMLALTRFRFDRYMPDPVISLG